jgi:DNA-binding NtrC family response regulator
MKSDFKILLVEDSQSFRDQVVQLLGAYNDIDGVGDLRTAREAIQQSAYDVVILDKGLPDGDGITLIPEIKAEHPNTVVIMLTADGDSTSVKKCMAAGADDYVVKSENVVVDLLVRIPFVVERQADSRRLRSLKEQVREAFKYEIIGKSRPTMELREHILSVKSATSSHFLITGESGTGKELIARRLNALVEGKQRQLVTINCSAIPENLIEEELFGHQKGTFTGATDDKPGKFELAHNGDLFLDEIGDLPYEAQGKLLRVVQDGAFFRVGGTKPIQVNCRVIAATNKDLEEMVRKKQFREDLFYRLNVVRIRTTPLRSRMEDVSDLAKHMALQLGGVSISVSNQAVQRLMQHTWPGNIRELRNTIERSILRARHRVSGQTNSGTPLSIEPEDIILDFISGPGAEIRKLESTLPLDVSDLSEEKYRNFMDAAEREYFLAALNTTKGNAVEAGLRVGMARSTVFRKLALLGISRRQYSGREMPEGLENELVL